MTARDGEAFDALLSGNALPARPERTGSGLDPRRAWPSPRARTVLRRTAPVVVLLAAAVTRLVGLGSPAELVFDETYYVKDGWTTWNLGYESNWPNDADARFVAGETDVWTGEGSFAVHPPLGKWLIGLGMAVVGPDDPFGWRIAAAIAGIALVGLVMLVTRRLTGSTLLAAIAGGLLAIDGQGIVMSRTALLDGFLALFALLGFWFALLDHDRTTRTGAVWARPWLVAAGVALGAATAVKWSGLWFLALFGLMAVLGDPNARRGAGAFLARAGAGFLLLVPVAAAVHLASWLGWLLTDDGYGRHWADEDGNAWTGGLAWAPHWLQSWLHRQQVTWDFHVGLTSEHPYRTPAWAWLALVRPTSFWFASPAQGDDGCTLEQCWRVIDDLPNPLIWYASIVALGFLVVRMLRRPQWRIGAVLVGVAAGYLPWLLFPERTVFQFYTIAFEPFLIIGLAMLAGVVIGRPGASGERRIAGLGAVTGFLVVATVISIWFWPAWVGMPVPPDYLRSLWWSPTWV